VLDVIGHKLDTRPVPILYVGPSKEFLTDQFEPRLMSLFDEAATLSHKVVRGRAMKKTLKRVSGVPVRLAHAGSSTALKSDPAAFAAVDEYDEMMANIRGQGDPLGLVEARGVTYADFCALITSTPSRGAKETEACDLTGLEFWKVLDPDEIDSPIWKLWQEGTRYHWAWPCKHCDEYFIPRFSLLTWPKDATPSQARRETSMCCPHCGGVHDDADKADMNAKGVYVAPGMSIDSNGVVSGDPPETSTASFWASGLASPFVSWGERVERYLKALASGESDKVQTAVNAGFGETFIPAGGDVPSWEQVLQLRTPLPRRTVPLEAVFLTAGVDVQGNGLYYTVRGWGSRAQSWLIDHGIMWGDTSMPEVWADLGEYLTQPIDGMYVKVAYIDSGFRPGKKFIVPENRVYEFCRQYRRFVFPAKGRATISNDLWIRVSRIEVNTQGKAASYGLDLVLINTDKAKSFVHERLRYPIDAKGAFLLHEEADEDYCKQIVAEARVKKPNGGFDWVPVSRENHFLDCFDPQTELLTDQGWMAVEDAVSYGGAFATVNLNTDEIEYQKATSSVRRRHVGAMVRLKGRAIDALVTPNHRMVTVRSNPVDETARITLAKDLTIWHRIKMTATWRGSDPAWVHLPAVDIEIPRRGGIHEPARKLATSDVCELLGWYVSEGHKRAIGRSRAVVISQNPGSKQERICALIDRCGFRWRITNGRQIVVTSRQLYDLVSECEMPGDGRGCYRKRVPDWVKGLAAPLIERFIEAAILGDGWVQNRFRTFATTSRVLANDMQELMLKIGKTASLRTRTVPACRIRGSEHQTAVQYHVSERLTRAALLRRADNAPIFETVDYNGMVYCVTVPNGTLIARRNGLPMIVGNCEAQAAAAAYHAGVFRLPDGARRDPPAPEPDLPSPAPEPNKPPPRRDNPRKSRFADIAARLNE